MIQILDARCNDDSGGIVRIPLHPLHGGTGHFDPDRDRFGIPRARRGMQTTGVAARAIIAVVGIASVIIVYAFVGGGRVDGGRRIARRLPRPVRRRRRRRCRLGQGFGGDEDGGGKDEGRRMRSALRGEQLGDRGDLAWGGAETIFSSSLGQGK